MHIGYMAYSEHVGSQKRKDGEKMTRFITKGVRENVSPALQLLLWSLVDNMPPPKDYLQVFKLTEFKGKQKITHIQEQPNYLREYLLYADTPVFVGKIFVIDDGTHQTML